MKYLFCLYILVSLSACNKKQIWEKRSITSEAKRKLIGKWIIKPDQIENSIFLQWSRFDRAFYKDSIVELFIFTPDDTIKSYTHVPENIGLCGTGRDIFYLTYQLESDSVLILSGRCLKVGQPPSREINMRYRIVTLNDLVMTLRRMDQL